MVSMLSFLLPLALAIAASPAAAYAVTRMTLAGPPSSGPPRASWGFLVGWFVGAFAVVAVAGVVAALVTSPIEGRAFFVVGALLLLGLGAFGWVLALRRWRLRPLPGEVAQWPSWAQGAGESDPARAAGLGFALAALDLKNLVLGVAAGVMLALSRASFGAIALSVLVFAIVAAAALLVVVLGWRFARERVEAPLERLAAGLELNLGGIEPMALVVVGGMLVGQGLALL